MSAVLHMFDIEARLTTCSLRLELKVEMFKVVPWSWGYMVDIARIYKRVNDAYQKSMYTNFSWVHYTNLLGSQHSRGNACISYILSIQIQGQMLNYFLRQNSELFD